MWRGGAAGAQASLLPCPACLGVTLVLALACCFTTVVLYQIRELDIVEAHMLVSHLESVRSACVERWMCVGVSTRIAPVTERPLCENKVAVWCGCVVLRRWAGRRRSW
jgi:hypothetical protein